MLPTILFWILGMIFVTGAVATAAVVYAALVIAARTDAIIGECTSEGADRGETRGYLRIPHLPRRVSA